MAVDSGAAVPTPIVSSAEPGGLVRLNTRRRPLWSAFPWGRFSSMYCPGAKRSGRSGWKLNSVVVGVSGREPRKRSRTRPRWPAVKASAFPTSSASSGELATKPRL